MNGTPLDQESILFEPAERRNLKLHIGITGVAGSGKTAGALRIAGGIVGDDWDRVFYIQTEVKDGNSYSGDRVFEIGKFKALPNPILPPYDPDRIFPVFEAAVSQGAAVVIFDSLSDVWTGEGGMVDQKNALGDSYSNWQQVNPQWFRFVNWLARTDKAHTITTMKAKTKYQPFQKPNGKWGVSDLGLGPIARPDTEYLFSAYFMLDRETHRAEVVSQTGSIFPPQIEAVELNQETGHVLGLWADGGEDYQIKAYGNGTFVDWFNMKELETFELYVQEMAAPPYNVNALRQWFKNRNGKGNKPTVKAGKNESKKTTGAKTPA